MWAHMSNYAGDYGWGWMLFGGLHMLAFWVLVIVGIWLLVRALTGTNRPPPHHKTPVDILKERYARGEIDKAEYEQRKADLER